VARGYTDTTRDGNVSPGSWRPGIDDDVEQNTLHLISVQGDHRQPFSGLKIQTDPFDERLVFDE